MNTFNKSIKNAVNTLKFGGLIGLPTETVYGLAADSMNPQAVEKVYQLKNRPRNHPLIVHIADMAELKTLIRGEEIPLKLKPILDRCWPGPLTVILPKSDRVNSIITGGQETVAIRMPAHPLARALIRGLGNPVVAPSANAFGKISPTTPEHVRESFPTLLVLDGGRSEIGIESTLIDAATDPNHAYILRHGMLTLEDLNTAAGCEYVLDTEKKPSIRAPGVLKSHYQPNKPLFIVNNAQELASILEKFGHQVAILDLPQTPEAYAYQLYFQLRLADSSENKAIVIHCPPKTHQWKGIWERLQKASYHN